MALPVQENRKISYEDYLQIDDDKRYEVIKGNLFMVPAPNTDHQNISGKIYLLIGNYINNNSLGEIFSAPIDLVIDKNNIVQPDILFISNENSSIIKKKGIFGAPDLIIEIISPSSKSRDVYEKKSLYESFKVKEYWLVDPASKTIDILFLNDKEIYELYDSGYLEEDLPGKINVKSAILPDIEINLEKIFNRKF